MSANRKSTTTQAICVRISEEMNLRIDTAVFNRRCQTGERVSRTALLLEIFDAALPPLPDYPVQVKKRKAAK